MWADGRLRSIDVATLPYPGIATDYKPLIVTMLSVADGVGIVTENLYPGRFRYVEELQRLGADIRADGHHAVVRGVPQLSGAPVRAPDIRAGAALVVAGLAADGETSVAGVHHVDRGYDDLVGRLAALGADIERVARRPDESGQPSRRWRRGRRRGVRWRSHASLGELAAGRRSRGSGPAPAGSRPSHPGAPAWRSALDFDDHEDVVGDVALHLERAGARRRRS